MKKMGEFTLACMFLLILSAIMPVAGAMANDWQKVDDSSWCNEKWSFMLFFVHFIGVFAQ